MSWLFLRGCSETARDHSSCSLARTISPVMSGDGGGDDDGGGDGGGVLRWWRQQSLKSLLELSRAQTPACFHATPLEAVRRG